MWTRVTWFALRTSIDPVSLSEAVRREVAAIDKDQPVDQLRVDRTDFETSFAEPKFQAQLMGAFALLALVLASVGIYGVNAYAVVQRQHEIGVRIALGASPRAVVADIVMQGMRLTAIGIVLGLAGAVAIASLLKSVLVGVSATDPLTLAAVAVLLAAVAALACYIPARRATRIDPGVALRQQ